MEQSIFSAEEFKKLKPAKGAKRQKREEKLQIKVCEYLKDEYPNVIWFCDVASGMKLPIWLAARHKKMRSGRGIPDLMIAHSKILQECEITQATKQYNGLFIELKTEEARLKNGNISASAHHREQQAVLTRLEAQGFKAVFGCGYSEAIKLIDEYLQ
jgi:hypothetical protein